MYPKFYSIADIKLDKLNPLEIHKFYLQSNSPFLLINLFEKLHKEDDKWNLPHFPEIKHKYPQDLAQLFKDYLEELIENEQVRYHSVAFYEFIEHSLVPINEGAHRYKQGYLRKRTGGRYKENLCQVYCGIFCRRWLNRWFVLTDDGILYTINSFSSKIREMLLFDQSFKFDAGRKNTGTKVGITLITPTRKLALKANNLFDAIGWVSAI